MNDFGRSTAKFNQRVKSLTTTTSEVRCPNCSATIDSRSWDGRKPNVYKELCPECQEYFMVQTAIDVVHTAYKAPCQNGEPHQLRHVFHSPPNWPEWVRCEWCGWDDMGDYDDLGEWDDEWDATHVHY